MGEEKAAAASRYTGPHLRGIREQLGLDLKEMEQVTKVRWIHFDAIEHEQFQKLPAEVFLRGYLRLYAQQLGLDPARVVADYMVGYRAWAEKKEPPKH